MSCKHMKFDCNVVVNRLEDSGRFMAEVRISCSECQVPFAFKGLRPGLDLGGAACSVFGEEARLAIEPIKDGKMISIVKQAKS